MTALENLAMVLLLVATAANGAAHYTWHMSESTRVLGVRFVAAAAAMVGVPGLLASRIMWPDWPARGATFLCLALATLGAAVWFHRARLALVWRATD